MRFAADERGLGLALVTFFAMLVIAALLFIVMDAAFADLFEISSSNAETPGGADQITLAQAIWDNIMYVALFLAMLFLIGRAVREGART